MSRSSAVLLAWAVLAASACGGRPDVSLPEGQVLVGIGDSYVAGVELSRSGLIETPDPWFDRIARETGRARVNLAVAGATTRDALVRAASVQPGQDDVVVVGTGTNDMRRYGTDGGRLADYRSRLRSLVQEVADAGCVILLPVLPVVLYGLYPPADRGSQAAVVAYQLAAAEVAAETGAVLADAATAWNPSVMLAPDGAHPNQLGEMAIAESVLRALSRCAPARADLSPAPS